MIDEEEGISSSDNQSDYDSSSLSDDYEDMGEHDAAEAVEGMDDDD